MAASVEQSPLGRIYLPDQTPAGFALFYTTRDFDGYLNERSIPALTGFIAQRFGISAALRTCNQVHGVTVARVAPGTANWLECDSCDALWSDQKNVALAIKVADCLPVTLIDAGHHVIANIHSGWRGAASNITAATISALQRDSEFSPASAVAFLGPSIRQCCFEVGPEVVEAFAAHHSQVNRHVDGTRGARPYLDLIGVTTEILAGAGIPRTAIHDSSLCTRCPGSDFHSYRRERATGRNLAVVAA
jgi:YfiH family protein